MNTEEKVLLEAIQRIERIAASKATPEFIYDRVFNIHSSVVRPMLDNLGIDFDWYDPDTTYEEDVRAYVDALANVKANLLACYK